MAGGRAPMIVVLALGAAVLGGPEALRLLLTLAGQSPAVDIAICVVVLAMVTAQLLGVVMLARFVRKAPAAPAGAEARRPRAPATDLLAKTTQVVSVGVAFLVTACLVAVSGSGGGLMSSVFDFAAGERGLVLLLCIVPLLRAFRATARFARAP